MSKTRETRTNRKLQTLKKTNAAIVAGLAHAEQVGYTKPHDVALAIRAALKDAGLKIIRNPRHKPTCNRCGTHLVEGRVCRRPLCVRIDHEAQVGGEV